MAMQQEIRTLILNFLADGQVKTTDMIRAHLKEKGIDVEKDNNSIRGALHSLKVKELIANVGTGAYQCAGDCTGRENMDGKVDLDKYLKIPPSTKKIKLKLAVKEDATVALNKSLADHFSDRQITMYLDPNGETIVLCERGAKDIHVSQSGRFRNYFLHDRLLELNIQLPAEYEGYWNAKEGLWKGRYVASRNSTEISSE